MTILFFDYDTTAGDAVASIVANILTHPDWADVTPAPSQTTTTSATGTSTGSLTWNVADTSGFYVGQHVAIGAGTANETTRTITAINSGTQMVVTGPNMPTSFPVGSTVRSQAQVLKATTTRGAPMVVNFLGGPAMTNGFIYEVMRDHSGATAGQLDPITRYLYWKASTMLVAQTVHVTISVSQEHLFVMVEGPRGHEAGSQHATYGSVRNYMFLSDLEPYHANDTLPVVVHGGGSVAASAYASTNNFSHQCEVSRSHDDNESWYAARLASLFFPTVYTTDVVTLERDCTLDGKKYLFPYVLFGEEDGIRGRLSRFFYAGVTQSSLVLDSPAPVGEKVTFEGVVYKLLAVNKGDGGSSFAWAGFGSAANNGGSAGRSVVVAVPYAEAA